MTPAELAAARTHRLAQQAVAAATVGDVRGLWRILDPDDLAGTMSDWLEAVTRAIAGRFDASAALARTYVRAVRTAALGQPPAGTLPAVRIDRDRITTSLMVTGPVRLERAARRSEDASRALRIAQLETARAAARHSLDGSRQTLTAYTATDRRAGWARITSGNACKFCEMLAGRGAVYSSETADFQAHDGCGCQPAIEFSRT